MCDNPKKIYIALISVHGLIRGSELELGRDADTGGQTLYVLELAQALSEHADVAQVDLFTRKVVDKQIAREYAEPFEQLNDKLRIVRIEAGPEQYIYKEGLWDWLDNFSDNMAEFFRQQKRFPDLIHSHYADAGFVGAHVANLLGIPLIYTGHSLGRVKRRRLLASGLTAAEIETRYNMTRRIGAEELALATAECVITSTYQEIEEQYEIYDYYQPDNMQIIPPGTNIEQFQPPSGNELHDPLFLELTRHLINPEKPVILALSRPDKRKNIAVLIEAYGESELLQERANLVIVAGNRDDIDDLEEGAREVFHELLVAMDRYDLYGKVALPKHHKREQVPMIYRIAAASGGVFVNPALTEPFGLTLIEAAASGLPVVATEDGGPRDIMGNCRNGILIDPLEVSSITSALERLLTDDSLWQSCSDNGLNGVREHYSWQAHAERYLEVVKPVANHSRRLSCKLVDNVKASRNYATSLIVTDLDLNLIGDSASLQALIKLLREHKKTTKFVIATGRRLDEALRVMKKHHIPEPDILMTSSGTEIYYAPKLTPDEAWTQHIEYHWTPHRIRPLLDEYAGLHRQPKLEQSRFKLSYYIDPDVADIDDIKRLLHRAEQSVYVQLAFGQYLDILPQRASKGMALRYVADRWQIPLEHIFVAGGSGADEDMMRGNTLAAVVANRHHEELSQLEESKQIYFATKAHAAGIIESLEHYDFFNLPNIKKNVS